MLPTRPVATLLPLLLSAAPILGQDLRRAVQDADVVVVARQVGKQTFSAEVELHRLQFVESLRNPRQLVTAVVIDWPKLSLHNRPTPRQSRLYCLADATTHAARIGLPADGGPYFRMSGNAGSNPLVGQDLAADPWVAFTRALTAGERGTAAEITAPAFVAMALGVDATIRLEATRHLAEQPLLRPHVPATLWSQLLARTAGESEDLDYKIALAELCAEQRVDGTIDALVLGLDAVRDRRYACAVGRLCGALRGEAAAEPLLARLQLTADRDQRAALLLAVGATRTGPALDALLQLRPAEGVDAALDAALEEHGSQRALDAVLRRPK